MSALGLLIHESCSCVIWSKARLFAQLFLSAAISKKKKKSVKLNCHVQSAPYSPKHTSTPVLRHVVADVCQRKSELEISLHWNRVLFIREHCSDACCGSEQQFVVSVRDVAMEQHPQINRCTGTYSYLSVSLTPAVTDSSEAPGPDSFLSGIASGECFLRGPRTHHPPSLHSFLSLSYVTSFLPSTFDPSFLPFHFERGRCLRGGVNRRKEG